MAELRITVGLENVDLGKQNQVTNLEVTTTNQGLVAGIESVGTSRESISVSGMTAPGWGWFRNLDDTNYIEFGYVDDDVHYWQRLLPDHPPTLVFIAPAVDTIYFKANTAACDMEYYIYEA